MWKRTSTILFLTSILLLPAVWKAFASVDAISLKDYPSSQLNLLLEDVPNRELLNKIILLPPAEFSYEETAKMITTISVIPETILFSLVQQHVQLYLFDGSLTEIKGFEHLKGTKPRGYSSQGPSWDDVPGIGGSKLVLAKIGHSNIGQGHGSVNLELHELAHSIDRFVYGNVRYNEEFIKIWKKEAPILFPNQTYFLHFIEEYFAETFAMYYLNEQTNEHLLKLAPLTHKFFEDSTNIKNSMNLSIYY